MDAPADRAYPAPNWTPASPNPGGNKCKRRRLIQVSMCIKRWPDGKWATPRHGQRRYATLGSASSTARPALHHHHGPQQAREHYHWYRCFSCGFQDGNLESCDRNCWMEAKQTCRSMGNGMYLAPRDPSFGLNHTATSNRRATRHGGSASRPVKAPERTKQISPAKPTSHNDNPSVGQGCDSLSTGKLRT